MKSLDQSQLDHVKQALTAVGVKSKCRACSKPNLSIGRHLMGVHEFMASPDRKTESAGTMTPADEAVLFVMVSCDNCGYTQFHNLVKLGLGEMAG
jgi:hypothetical protein